MLGTAYSSLASARSVGAVVIAPMLILQFISGVYFAFTDIPGWLQQVASVFPLKWIAQGMRSVFFPDQLAVLEMAGALGARPHRARPRRLGGRRARPLRPHLPLVQARHDMMAP